MTKVFIKVFLAFIGVVIEFEYNKKEVRPSGGGKYRPFIA